jgi:hypothetical protein
MNEVIAAALAGVITFVCIIAYAKLESLGRKRHMRAQPYRQPVPDVTADDVKRVVRRDFPDSQSEEAMAVLNGYSSQWRIAAARVQLGALKLADGDIESLRRHVAAANQDYRDVLTAAEYPGYWKATSSLYSLPAGEHQRLMDADWRQYEAWLRK